MKYLDLNKNKFVVIGFFFFLMTQSCIRIVGNVVNAKNKQFANDTIISANNRIYLLGKTFVYDVVQREKNREIKFNLEQVVVPGVANLNESKQKYTYLYNKNDFSPEEYASFLCEGNVMCPEYTSITATEKRIFMHPPRTNTLKKLEIAPFPNLYDCYKLQKGDAWFSYFTVSKHKYWGEYAGTTFKRNYSIKSVEYNKDSIPSGAVIFASSKSKKFGTNTLTMHFDIDSGFTRLYYNFYDSTSIDLILKEIR